MCKGRVEEMGLFTWEGYMKKVLRYVKMKGKLFSRSAVYRIIRYSVTT